MRRGTFDSESVIVKMFEPDQLMPSQWAGVHVSRNEGPPARLYRRMVEDAVADLAKYACVVGPKPQQLVANALDWITDYDDPQRRFTVSFAVAIEAGYRGLDPEILSEQILRDYRHLDPRPWRRRSHFVSRRGKGQGRRRLVVAVGPLAVPMEVPCDVG